MKKEKRTWVKFNKKTKKEEVGSPDLGWDPKSYGLESDEEFYKEDEKKDEQKMFKRGL